MRTSEEPTAWTQRCDDESETGRLAARLSRCTGIEDAIVWLRGDLGAGKTTFVRHLLRALGVAGRIKSPTYAIVEPHEAPASARFPAGLSVSHFDFYRFNDPREWEDAGFRELFARPGLKLVEWPDRAANCLPPPDLDMTLESLDHDARCVHVRACTARGISLLEGLRA